MLDYYFKNSSNCIGYGHTIDPHPESLDFHLHTWFEIYFFISGDVNYFVERKVYPLKHGDLLIMNNHEVHKPSFKSNAAYERIVIHFDQTIPQLFSSPDFDLLNCFKNRPIGERNKIFLSNSQLEELLKLFHKIELLKKSPSAGADILKLSHFIELLVLINRAFASEPSEDDHANVPEKLIPVLEYIDNNLHTDLSLELLEHKFFINRFHLSRMFKKSIGSNLHEYIVFKRISKAKKLLSDNHSVTEACQLSGFNDYSNFIKTFSKIVGQSPGKYKREAKYISR